MLQQVMHDLKGDAIVARDGRLGSVDDVYFDDREWKVRYLVVDTGEWLPGRQVLISPQSVAPEAHSAEAIPVKLTREQVRDAPGIDADQPVSRKFEEAHAAYYGHPYYWQGLGIWAAVPLPGAPQPAGRGGSTPELRAAEADARATHLRSGREVAGYKIEAVDGEIGHVEDLLINDEDWSVRDLVVDTRNWLPGRHVLVPPSAVETIEYETRRVRVRLTKEEVRSAARAK